MTNTSAASARSGRVEQQTATKAAAKPPGWQLVERLKSADSISQLNDITAAELIEAFHRSADTKVELPSFSDADADAAVSRCSRRDQQLSLLFGAASNLLQLYYQTTDDQDALDFAPVLDLVLQQVSRVVEAASCPSHCTPQHLAVYQQQGQLPAYVMAGLQVLDIVQSTGELL